MSGAHNTTKQSTTNTRRKYVFMVKEMEFSQDCHPNIMNSTGPYRRKMWFLTFTCMKLHMIFLQVFVFHLQTKKILILLCLCSILHIKM